MVDYASMQKQLVKHLALERPPVAVIFGDSPPPGVAKFTGTEPSGCSFWRLAAAGRTFYTVPDDHYNCPIGSYTHNISLPPERASELEQVLGVMISVGYLRMEEVPGIPRLAKTPAAIIYSPLAQAPLDPDVVLFSGQPGSLALLNEAAVRAGVASQLSTLGRPTCMALPASLEHGVVASTGCIGNRVYTDLGAGEMYIAVRGKDLAKVAAEVDTIAAANLQLQAYHSQRRQSLASE
jgi:uncharacterized protein (DUF169 family)